ncbi:MAG TPA: cation:proton antiporter [Gaiellaceae bacterium]|nr:cation:proton antiporter [Gaiellaceae bacterium]
MGEVEFTSLLIVVATAFAAPFVLGLAPSLRLPAVVLEIVAGIVIGPSVLGWVSIDDSIRVLATIGLAFLLFLAGLEIDFRELKGRAVRLTGVGFLLSFGIAIGLAFVLKGAGLVETPLFVAIVLTATSLGIVVPVLKDSNEISSSFGQLVVAAATIADFAAIILLSLFFSREATGIGTQLVLLGGLALFAVAVALFLAGAERSMSISSLFRRLQDTTAQIRVRGAFVLLVGLAAVAEHLGLEVILGAFIAGAVLTLIDTDRAMTHPQFRLKLEAAGYGIFIPIFFVASGVGFDLDALTESASTLVLVPVCLAVLLAVRGLPALLYRGSIGGRRTAVAALLQSTSLPFIVAAAQIGMELGTISAATGAALVGAGILSVLLFPLAALTVLKSGSLGHALEPEPAR